MSQDDLYLKRKLVAFCKEVGMLVGLSHLMASRNWLKRCIRTCQMVGAKLKEERKKSSVSGTRASFSQLFFLNFSHFSFIDCVDVIKNEDVMSRLRKEIWLLSPWSKFQVHLMIREILSRVHPLEHILVQLPSMSFKLPSLYSNGSLGFP